MPRQRHFLPVLVLCSLFLALAAIPIQAKDLCCVVNCVSGPTTCHHWDTFGLWADAKCSALYIAGACRGGEAQVHAGNCSDDNNCTPANTTHSPKTQGVGVGCKKDSDCPGSTRCSTPILKRNVCVVPCQSDNDCPTGEKCKKPVGTTFFRCK
ncbi:MAG TPA: hypothetical protein VF173_19265 [Thermoanaerobaculia bacterium]|nr:hypothetical protein [Thermoanaerobaculia bacterium]